MAKKHHQQLHDLTSVGPATVQDFALLGITTMEQLVAQDPHVLYAKLCKLMGTKVDICVQDVFAAAIAQAENKNLLPAQRTWFYYSRRRKMGRNYYD